MYARVTISEGNPDQIDEATTVVRDSVLPAAGRQKGFAGYLLLADRGSGKAITISFWETQADRAASGAGSEYFNQVIAIVMPFLTGTPVSEEYEVLIQT